MRSSDPSEEEASSVVVEATATAALAHGGCDRYYQKSSSEAAAAEAEEGSAIADAFAGLDLDGLESLPPLIPYPSTERQKNLPEGPCTPAGTEEEGAPDTVVTTLLWLDPHNPDPFVPDFFASEDYHPGSNAVTIEALEKEEEKYDDCNLPYTDDELLDVLNQLDWQPIGPPDNNEEYYRGEPFQIHRRRGSPTSSASEASSSPTLELLHFGDDEGAELPNLDSILQIPNDFWNQEANGVGSVDDDPVDWEGVFDDDNSNAAGPPPPFLQNYGLVHLPSHHDHHPLRSSQFIESSERGVLQLLDQLSHWELNGASTPSIPVDRGPDLEDWNDDLQWKAATQAAANAASSSTGTGTLDLGTLDIGAYRTVDPTLNSDDENNDFDDDSLWVPNPGDDNYDDEYIPPSWYCQPCGPSQQPFDEQQKIRATQYDLDAFLDAHPAEAPEQRHLESDFDVLSKLSELLERTAVSDRAVESTNNAVASNVSTLEPPHPATMAESASAAPNATQRSIRPDAERAVQFLLSTFQSKLWQGSPTCSPPHSPPPLPVSSSPKGERLCLGHRERILGMDASECGRFLATASQEGSVRIWNIPTNALLRTLVHTSDNYECLRVAWASAGWGNDRLDRSESGSSFRYLLASGGADGRVQLWASPEPLQGSSWTEVTCLDHSTYRHFAPTDDADKPQIYSLQFVDHWRALPLAEAESQNSFLVTSSDDHLHVWELDDAVKRSKSDAGDDVAAASDSAIQLREVFSLRFGHLHDAGYGIHLCQVTGLGLPVNSSCGHREEGGVADATETPPTGEAFFGGDRNPHRLVYVFDASYCRSNGLVAVALSDGSLRILNGRGVCVTVLRLPGANPPHLTSFGWDFVGRRLATSVATGQVIAWDIDWNDGGGAFAGDAGASSYGVRARCRAVLDGGHAPGRPVFGVAYCGTNGDVLLSWGSDGRLCAWDSAPPEDDEDQLPADAALLSVLLHKPDYPLYAVSLRSDGLAVAGGGSEPSFVGIPAFLYDFPSDTIPSPPPPPVVDSDVNADN